MRLQRPKAYIREKLAKSRLMIQSIDQRLSMIERIAGELITSNMIILNGCNGLKPLNNKRITGILRCMSNGQPGGNGQIYANSRVIGYEVFFKPGVRTISGSWFRTNTPRLFGRTISKEDKGKPYSDATLVTLLSGRIFPFHVGRLQSTVTN